MAKDIDDLEVVNSEDDEIKSIMLSFLSSKGYPIFKEFIDSKRQIAYNELLKSVDPSNSLKLSGKLQILEDIYNWLDGFLDKHISDK